MTIALTLAEAFERARGEAPGIAEEDFLDQTRVLLQHSRIKASAVRAVIRHDSETYEPIPEHCAASELDAREQIPADAWVNLALWFSNGGSASGWGHKHALPDRREFPEDGCFEGLEVYVGVVLIAEAFNGLWTGPSAEGGTRARQEAATWAAIDKLGVESLRNMRPAKRRDDLVIKTVREDSGLSVSDKYVREFISGDRKRPT